MAQAARMVSNIRTAFAVQKKAYTAALSCWHCQEPAPRLTRRGTLPQSSLVCLFTTKPSFLLYLPLLLPIPTLTQLSNLSDRNLLCLSVRGDEAVFGCADHALYCVDLSRGTKARRLYGTQSNRRAGHSEWVSAVVHTSQVSYIIPFSQCLRTTAKAAMVQVKFSSCLW